MAGMEEIRAVADEILVVKSNCAGWSKDVWNPTKLNDGRVGIELIV